MKSFEALKLDYEKGNINLEELTNQVSQKMEFGDPDVLDVCCVHPYWTEICKSEVLENE